MILLLINGPRGAGKSTIARAVSRWLHSHSHVTLGIADQLKIDAAAEYGLGPEWVEAIEAAGLKDVVAVGDDLTPRQIYIARGNMLRGLLGESVVADAWAAKVRELDALMALDVVIVPDVRLQIELEVAKTLGDVLLLKVFRDGHSWDGDIGGYLDAGSTKCMVRHNDVALAEFDEQEAVIVGGTIRRMLRERKRA